MFGNLTYWAVTQIRPHEYIYWNGETLRVLESHPLDTKYEKTARAFALLTEKGWFCQSYGTIVAWEGYPYHIGDIVRTWKGCTKTTSKHLWKFRNFIFGRRVVAQSQTPGIRNWINHIDSGHQEYILEEGDCIEDGMEITDESRKTPVAYYKGKWDSTSLTYGEIIQLETRGALVQHSGPFALVKPITGVLEVYVPKGTYHRRYRVVASYMFGSQYKKLGVRAFPEFASEEEAMDFWNSQGKPKYARGKYFASVEEAEMYANTMNRLRT